mmetsp:Transcript_17278/g.47691  ORF Transcript_17278/g.47691 Transcript_17278/m.47691 type:complete len:245 (-) Transcript_17278:298-1032(-)
MLSGPAMASAPALPIKLFCSNSLAKLTGRPSASQPAPRSPTRLPPRPTCTRPTGSCTRPRMSSSAMWLLRRSRFCSPTGRFARSTAAPVSPIALLARNSLRRVAGSKPGRRAAPRSPMQFSSMLSISKARGIWMPSRMSSRVIWWLSSVQSRKPAGRFASNGPMPASVRPTLMRVKVWSCCFSRSCSAKRSTQRSPRALYARMNSSRSGISARVSKYWVIRSSVHAMRWKFCFLARFTASNVSW